MQAKPKDKLLDARYAKFRQMGKFLEGAEAAGTRSAGEEVRGRGGKAFSALILVGQAVPDEI